MLCVIYIERDIKINILQFNPHKYSIFSKHNVEIRDEHEIFFYLFKEVKIMWQLLLCISSIVDVFIFIIR